MCDGLAGDEPAGAAAAGAEDRAEEREAGGLAGDRAEGRGAGGLAGDEPAGAAAAGAEDRAEEREAGGVADGRDGKQFVKRQMDAVESH